jgi:hypothetical protein
MMHRKYLLNLNLIKNAGDSIHRPPTYSYFFCIFSLGALMLTGCETVVNSPSSNRFGSS